MHVEGPQILMFCLFAADLLYAVFKKDGTTTGVLAAVMTIGFYFSILYAGGFYSAPCDCGGL